MFQEPWADLEVPPFEPVAELTPDDADRLGVASDTTFTFRSLDGRPARDLAAGLSSDPAVEILIEDGPTPDVAIIRMAAPLAKGQRYRFRLEAAHGALAGTWAFVARSPLRVAGTLPGDRSVEVPPNTGIEMTFDQDGPIGVEERFSIEPRVTGRLEQHGRTWAFVPDRPLAAATIYAVTLRAGVGLAGSDEILEADVVFRFETDVERRTEPHLAFGRAILEVQPDTQPAVGVDLRWDRDEEEAPDPPRTATVSIHRLPTVESVVAAATTLTGPDGWAVASASASIPTDALEEVAELDGAIINSESGHVLRIPASLSPGAYVLTIRAIDGRPVGSPTEQQLLQVTNLSAYALTSTGDTLVWVNDLATGTAVPGATIRLANGGDLGTTAADGIARFRTPAALLDREDEWEEYYVAPPADLLAVAAPDGRWLLVPLGLPTVGIYGDGNPWLSGQGNASWWVMFNSDRSAYRQTDTINLYGVIRARADRSVPANLEVRLVAQSNESDAPIQRLPVDPTNRGVFAASMPLRDVPLGEYRLDLRAGGEHVASTWISVTAIRKPSYAIEVETDRNVYLDGQTVHAAAVARFYDGTAAPGLELSFGGFGGEPVKATTDATGRAVAVLTARYDRDEPPTDWRYSAVSVRPANPEEGQISGLGRLIVLPSRSWLVATGSLVEGRIVIDGRLTSAEIAGMEAEAAARRRPRGRRRDG